MRLASISPSTAHGALRERRLWLLGLLALAVILAIALLPPFPDPRLFASLADQRTLFGIPNFFDVASNAAFLLVGTWGLYFVASHRGRAFSHPAEKWPYAFLFLSVALTGIGSAYYHLAPDDARLMWDRLPIALGFMALLSAVIAERIGVRLGLYMLWPLLFAGAASVLYWRWSLLNGAEDVLPYAAVQYGAIAALVIIALLYRSPYTRGADLLGVVALYGAAKAAEALDAQIYALGEILSGHTLKHLFAALAVWWLLRMLQLRSAL
jgi:hypothetical protein